MSAALAALLLAPSAFAAPAQQVESIFAEIDALVASRNAKDAREIRADGRRAESLFENIRPLGADAIEPLLAIAVDPKRPAKSRFWAASFIGRTKDPAALEPLRRILDDALAPDFVRAASASGIAGLKLPAYARREPLCAAISGDPPKALLGQLLAEAATLGCPSPDPLLRRAKSYGSRPSPSERPQAAAAIRGLSRTTGAAGAKALIELAEFFAKGEPPRLLALAALASRARDLEALAPKSGERLCRLLSEGASLPSEAVAAVRLIGALKHRPCAPVLARLLEHPDAALVVTSAEALAAIGAAQARPRLRDILENAHEDARFAPGPGRPDPRALLSRLEKSIAAFPLGD